MTEFARLLLPLGSLPTTMRVILDSQTTGPSMNLIAPDGTVYGHDNLPDGISYQEDHTYQESSRNTPTQSFGLGQLRVVHGVANGPAMDVLVNDNLVFSNVTFTSTTIHEMFESGAYTIKFVETGTTSPVLAETSVNLAPGLDYTIVATGEPGNIVAWSIQDENTPRGDGQSYLRLVHAGHGLNPVNLVQPLGKKLFGEIAYQRTSQYYQLYPQGYNFDLLDSETKEILVELSNVLMLDGIVYTMFVFNTADGVVTTLHVDAIEPATLNIVQVINSDEPLTISIDGIELESPMTAGSYLGQPLSVYPGEHAIQVKTVTGTTILSDTILLSMFGDYTLALYEKSDRLNGVLLDSDHLPSVAKTGLRVVPLLEDVSAVDVTLEGMENPTVIPIFDNVAFATPSEMVDIQPSAKYWDANDPTKLFGTELFTVTFYEAGTQNKINAFYLDNLESGTSQTAYIYRLNGTLQATVVKDQQAVKKIQGIYKVDKPQVGNWQVQLIGDSVNGSDYQLEVMADKLPPELKEVQVTNGDQPTIQWRLTSSEPDTSIAVYYKTSPIMETVSITDTDGTVDTLEALVYTGRTITDYLTASNDPTWTDGSLQNYDIPTELLRSGTYYVYLEADDMASQYVRLAAPEPLVVEHIWPSTWQSGLVLSQTNYREVTAQWNSFSNPDVQEYRLMWQSSVYTETQTSSQDAYAYQTEPLQEGVYNLNPGETYTFTVEARTYENDWVSTSESVAITVQGAKFNVVPPTNLPTIQAGETATTTIKLTTNLDPYPSSVGLYSGPRTPGLEMSFSPSTIVPTITGTEVVVTLLANEFLPNGAFTATVEAVGGGEEVSVALDPTVVAPTFVFATNPSALVLTENGTTSMSIVPNRLNGHTVPIWIEVVDNPLVMWSFNRDLLHGNESTVLTIEDTPLTQRGVYTMLIQGYDEGGPNRVTITRTLTIRKPDFVVTGISDPISVTPGQTNTVRLPLQVIFQDGWSNPVNLMTDQANAPFGVQFGFETNSKVRQTSSSLKDFITLNSEGSVDLMVETLSDTPQGYYLLPLIAESNGRRNMLEIELLVGETLIVEPEKPDAKDIYLPTIKKEIVEP
ncbi:DUF4397 domain-containing protein [Anaerolineales bacterium HSG25]|nr:DUF4397 domain-containing protein [Anaerolineales bacterium HSG25]